jgi:hypothetical protein
MVNVPVKYTLAFVELLGCIMQGRGNKSSGDNFHAAPNIDHSQEFVRKDLKEWLLWLR